MTPRDTQKSRLYEAERASIEGVGPQRMALTECQAYVDKVLTSAFVQTRWGRRRVGVIATHSSGNSQGGVIALGVWARQPAVILHELAHELLHGKGYAAHGPEFAACLLLLVGRFLGREHAAKLRAAFAEKRVRYRTGMAALPKPGSRPVITKAAVAQQRAAAVPVHREVSAREAGETAKVLRRAIADGMFGPPGRKPRAHAQAVARTLEAKASGRT